LQKYVTIDRLAQETGFHPQSLRRLARMGRLPGAHKVGARWLIDTETLFGDTAWPRGKRKAE